MRDWSLLEFPDTKEAHAVPRRVREFVNDLIEENKRLRDMVSNRATDQEES